MTTDLSLFPVEALQPSTVSPLATIDQRFLGITEVAERLEISRTRIYSLASRGLLPPVSKAETPWRWPAGEVERYARSGGLRPGERSPAVQRIWAKVIPSPDGCWIWTGSQNDRGYGSVWVVRGDHRRAGPHVVMYREVIGSIPEGLQLDHLCRNPSCCNPWHLEPVTCRENILRGFGVTSVNATKTQCHRGHEFTEANTYRHPTGRNCRRCHADAEIRRRARSRHPEWADAFETRELRTP